MHTTHTRTHTHDKDAHRWEEKTARLALTQWQYVLWFVAPAEDKYIHRKMFSMGLLYHAKKDMRMSRQA